MELDLDLVFIISYECPGCLVMLEDRSSRPPGWLRCPRCGRPSLPPDHQDRQSGRSPFADALAGTAGINDFLSDELTKTPRAMAPLPLPGGRKPSHVRLLLGIGAVSCFLLLMFSLYDRNGRFDRDRRDLILCFLLAHVDTEQSGFSGLERFTIALHCLKHSRAGFLLPILCIRQEKSCPTCVQLEL